MTRVEIKKEFEKLHPPRNDLSEKEVLQHGALVVTAVNFADHILRVAESKRWRQIETAPRDKTKILVMGNHSDDEYRPYLKERKDLFWYAVACWDGWREDEDRFSRLKRDSHYWVFCKDGHSTFTKPTHWMPLPSAPEESK